MRSALTLTGVAIRLVAAGVALSAATSGCQSQSKAAAPRAVAEAHPSIRFEEIAARSGLDFTWVPNPRRPLTILDTFGAGCAFLDFNADGLQDIFLVGEPRCGLFLNRGNRSFEDVSESSGLPAFTGQWKGCAVGDYNGDGFPDILISAYRGLRLLRNDQGRRLVDVTVSAGLPPDNQVEWGSSCGFMDLDGDRDLDLVLGNYAVFNSSTPHYCELVKGVKSGCTPQSYQPEFARLYRNDGGKFKDVSREAGMKQAHGRVLTVTFCDFNKDGRVDFYLANDGTPADLMQNQGGLRFRNVGTESGTAYGNVPGQPIAAMGVDWADVDGDGWQDFAVSAFENEAYSLQRNEGDGLFSNVASSFGIVDETFRPLGFGTTFFDADNDGYPELFFANGHVYDNVDQIYIGSTFRQPMMLFQNLEGKRYVNIASQLGEAWSRPIVGRGSARGDIDNDGRIDLLVVDYDGKPLLFHNQSPSGHHWLTVTAKGRGGNREGYGLRAEAKAGGRVWVGEILPSASYLSTSAPLMHWGLGSTSHLDQLVITWPSGKKQTFTNVEVDRIMRVEEPA